MDSLQEMRLEEGGDPMQSSRYLPNHGDQEFLEACAKECPVGALILARDDVTIPSDVVSR